ncbi:hypothetical protein F4805DRAFT_23242 [Annulohypoxylon moriforme]|nr:hypothetical protein F4805DRAFT_23242 [Annulohypoxylon moriforme]
MALHTPQTTARPISQRSQSSDADEFLNFERSAKNFQIFVGFLMPISIFGASVFSIILGQMADPKDTSNTPILSLATVRILLALAWLSFVLVIGLGGLSLGFLATHEESSQGTLTPIEKRKLKRLGFLVVVLLYGFTMSGFVFMAIALAAYVQIVAFAAIGCMAIAIVIATVACFRQWQEVPN